MLPDHVKRQIVSSIQQAADRIYHSTDPSDLEAVKRAATAIGTVVQAGQMTYANMVGSDLARTVGLKDLLPVDVSITERLTVSKPVEYERPFRTAIKSSVERGAARLDRMVVTDIQMGGIRQAQKVLRAAGRKTYHRVPTGDNPCALCEIASTRTYYTKDLLPIHPGCMCSIEAGPPEDRTIDTAALGDSGDQKKLIAPLIESGAGAKEYQSLVAVNQHGEIGSIIGWAHQKFTGPEDLPTPPSKEVLAQQAYDIVRANGGITIDLAGHQPHDGYAYAPYKTTEFKVKESEFTPKHVDDYIDKHHKELARPGNNLGMWTEDGYVYLDVSRVGAPTAETFAKAQAAHQLAVCDLGNNYEIIPLGTIDPATKGYTRLGTSADLHRQYREQVARADEAGRAGSLAEVPGSDSGSPKRKRAKPLEWDGPPIAPPSTDKDVISTIQHPWISGDIFDATKGDMRRGAREAQLNGYTGLPKWWESETHPGPGPDLRPKAMKAKGAEWVSTVVHSPPTEDVMWRGVYAPTARAKAIKVGETLSMPLSSFTQIQSVAEDFASGELAYNKVQRGTSVVFRVDSGARMAPVTHNKSEGEYVGFGQFKVTKVVPAKGDSPMVAYVHQTSMMEDLGQTLPPGTSALKAKSQKPIPEFTVVGEGKSQPQFGTIDLKTGAINRSGDYITKVQPGPIPDYDNSYAVSAQLHARHPDLQVDLGTMIDPKLSLSTARELDDLVSKYPAAQLRSAIARSPSNFQHSTRYAQTDVFDRRVLSGTEIQFNNSFYLNKGTLEKSYAKTTAIPEGKRYGYHPPLGEGNDAAKAIAAHEFGHTMDASGSYRAGAAVKDTLRREFLRLNPYTDEQKAIDRVLVANAAKRGITIKQPIETRYEAWLHDSLSEYSFTQGGKLNPAEALAEAFGHTELDPHNITDAERVLHKLNVDMHTQPYRMGMVKPGWNMGVDTPAKVVDAKEAKRVAAQVKKDAAAAEKAAAKAKAIAEKEAANAAKKADLATPEGKIREARLQQLKGKERLDAKEFGDYNGIENVTRRGMDPERIKANREALWAEVPEPVRAEGKVWYPNDGQALLDIHRDAGSPLAGDPLADLKVRAIGSAFSPQVDWADAKTDASNYFRTFGQPYEDRVKQIVEGRAGMTYTESIRRADRIVAAKTVEEIDLALRGSAGTTSHYYDNSQKIRHFYRNLVGTTDPVGDHNLLTSDTWDGRAARLHPNERRMLINNDLRKRNASVKKPVPEEELHVYKKGEQIPDYLVARADKLADEANEIARAAGLPEPYMPSAPLMVQYGYDIIESATATALPPGYTMDEYQAGMWIWLRGSG